MTAVSFKAMTRLPGAEQRKLNQGHTLAAMAWLARLHAAYWGTAQADAAVATGLQPQGCFWSLDCCGSDSGGASEGAPDDYGELRMRLRLAAHAVDARLKADHMQTICHGDPKDHNIIVDGCGGVALCDFQWTGKAASCKDVAYCLICAAGSLSTQEEEGYLIHYHRELSEQLLAEGALVPPLEVIRESYLLASCDLARWMADCPYGWWGHSRVLRKHADEVLRRIGLTTHHGLSCDVAIRAQQSQSLQEAVFRAFPLVEW